MLEGHFGVVLDGRPWIWTAHPYAGMSLPPMGSGPSPEESRGSPKAPKVCGVCGDRAKSYHFGGISCDSCKAFFRRSVQNEAFKNFHCPYEGQCEITISSRKCCQYCRFQKCVSIGMEKGWVMTEEERLQMLKNRMEKRQRQEKQAEKQRRPGASDYEPDINQVSNYLSEEDIHTLETLVNLYETCYRTITFSDELKTKVMGRSRTEIIDMFFTVLKQFSMFAQRLESFAKISQKDKETLLRTGVLELVFIRGAFAFDERNACWPMVSKPLYRDSPILYAEDIKKLVSPDLFEKHLKFVTSIKELDPDEPTVMLLLVIVLLSPDRPGLENSVLVADEQERFSLLMKKYMTWRYGPETTSVLYPKLLLKLPDLRELADDHTDYHLRLDKEELEEIHQRLSSLKIDPSEEVVELPARTSSTLQSHFASMSSSSSSSSSSFFVRPFMRQEFLGYFAGPSPIPLTEESSSSESSERVPSSD